MTERNRAWRRAQAERVARRRARRKKHRGKTDPEQIIINYLALSGSTVEDALAQWQELEEGCEAQR